MEHQSLSEILNGFDLKQWREWIEGILLEGKAYPIDRFAPDDTREEVLVGMAKYLEKHEISTLPFEEAIRELLAHYKKEQRNIKKIDALLSVCITISTSVCKDTILRMIRESRLIGLYDDEHIVLGTAIQALGNMSLSSNEVALIKDYLYRIVDRVPHQVEIVVIAQALHFFRKHDDAEAPLEDFFTFLMHVLPIIDANNNDSRYSNAIMFGLYDAALYRTDEFFPAYFEWYEDIKRSAGGHAQIGEHIINKFSIWMETKKDLQQGIIKGLWNQYLKPRNINFRELELSEITYSTATNMVLVSNTQLQIDDHRIMALLINYADLKWAKPKQADTRPGMIPSRKDVMNEFLLMDY